MKLFSKGAQSLIFLMSTLHRDRKSSAGVCSSQGSMLWSWPHLAFGSSLTSSWPLPVFFLLSSAMDVVVQSLSHVWLLVIPQTAARQASLSFTISWSLLKLSPLSQWCHPTISSSAVPFSSCLQFFLAPGSFPMSQLFTSGGQKIGAFHLAYSFLCCTKAFKFH